MRLYLYNEVLIEKPSGNKWTEMGLELRERFPEEGDLEFQNEDINNSLRNSSSGSVRRRVMTQIRKTNSMNNLPVPPCSLRSSNVLYINNWVFLKPSELLWARRARYVNTIKSSPFCLFTHSPFLYVFVTPQTWKRFVQLYHECMYVCIHSFYKHLLNI